MSKIKVSKKLNKHKLKSKTKNNKKVSKKRVKFNLSENTEKQIEESMGESSDEEKNSEIQSLDGSENDFIVDHKKSLQSLKEKDPEFYQFLQKNDKQLLDFNDEESDEELEDLEEDKDLDEVTDETQTEVKLTLKVIDKWSETLNEKYDLETIKLVVKGFRKAVNQTSDESETQLISTEIFNAIVNVCLIDLLPAIHKYLRLQQIVLNESSNDPKMIDPSKSRNWKKLVSLMKCYLTDVIKMLSVVSDSSLKATLLRHILRLIPFFITFPHLTKRVLKQSILLWSESDEKNRILSFLCILRLMRTQEQSMLSFILKKLYISYVKNSKFTTELSWPLINFMKQSLVELYSLDQSVAYQHTFIFLKQLAINLRTALTVKKKESFKCVYNWQYLHSILLWTQLLCSNNNSEELKPLICPLVNVIIGTIRLVPSPKYFPLRFHLIKALIKVSDETNTFIPILPLITEVFDHLDVNNKPKTKDSKKQMNFEVLIKVSKSNISDFEFRNTTVNKVYDLILHYLSTQSHKIAFPELVHVSLIKIRKFIKSCHIIQHNQLLKQLLEKIEMNCKLINDKRRSVSFSISDSLSIDSWERELKANDTPLNKFYNQWKKIKFAKESSEKVLLNDLIVEKNELTEPLVKQNDTKNMVKKSALKRKISEPNDEKTDENEKKNTRKRSRKRRKRVNKNKINKEFAVNETLDLSSDECE